ncbi:MAG: DNA mismatch repair protein MutS [Anaerolineae bacterium]
MSNRTRVTPIRRQYLDIKRQHPDAIVFFRLGDFYETFDEDAQLVADELDVVLTSRNVTKGQRVPMAGVPHHAADGYIAKLISRGLKVAICEQTSDEPVNGLMEREVVRIVTPGTVVEPSLLAEKRNNFLAAAVWSEGTVGLAYADITTGEFHTTQLQGRESDADLLRELDRLQPAELIISDGGEPHDTMGDAETQEARRRYPVLANTETPLTLYAAWRFEEGNCERALKEHLGVTTLVGFGCEDLPAAKRAAGVIVQYLREHQPAALSQLQHLATYSVSAFMTLDVATRRNLELTETLRDGRVHGSLLGVLDATQTPMGGRTVRRWITQPLLGKDALEARLQVVDAFYRDAARRTALRETMRGFGDLERLTNRVVQGIAGPRDLTGLKEALERMGGIRSVVLALATETAVSGASDRYPLRPDDLVTCDEAVDLIGRAIVDEPPATTTNGGYIRQGYSEELDQVAASVDEAKRWVADLERQERKRTGIKSLKVGYNKVFGYYLEVTKANTDAVPEEYIRKQTLVNAERYIIPELKEKESVILNAEERMREIEARAYQGVLLGLGQMADRMLAASRAVAHLDVLAGWAHLAAAHDYVRPELHDGYEIDIEAGRHPVVEQMPLGEPFVPNDCRMTHDAALHVITGPNMSGKSTYLRQVAQIVLMAQIGCFVPARRASIGIVDRIFARVGAQDEIARGQSTFMVEMVEMANILNHATERSLLILDEIGRGTSTYDGISIAWSVVEYLHNHPKLGCKTLFATHYHELTQLEELLPRVRNYNVAVASRGKEIVFTRHVEPGGADRSYGIHVARMAGLPPGVIHRAEAILQDLEADGAEPTPRRGRPPEEPQQLSLFAGDHPLLAEIREMDLMTMSPMDALNVLYEMQKRLKESD